MLGSAIESYRQELLLVFAVSGFNKDFKKNMNLISNKKSLPNDNDKM